MGMTARRAARGSARAPLWSAADGASAVEFALVSLFVFPLLFGMIQYGMFFNDYLQVRQGVRQGARTGVVQTPITDCGSATDYAGQIKCHTAGQISPVTGTVAVRVATPGGWLKGKPLLVCAVVKTAGSGGLVPMPSGGFVLAKTQMSIEQDATAPTGTFPATDSPDPTGKNWAWCS
jgi:Flp pilus assembly protein TadG